MVSSRWLQNGLRTANLATKMQNGAQHGSKMTMRRPQGRPRGCLGITLGRLGRLSERSWRLPDGPLGTFLKDILQIQAFCENSKKPKKINGFSLIFKVPGEFWEPENH